jgi:RNA polymerase sigma-70 factor (ECF subfamily)
MAAELTGLYRELQGRALFLTQNREAANDLVQQVCERALLKQALFERGTNLAAWLRRVMRNLFIDEVRSRRISVPVPLAADHEIPGPEMPDAETAAEDVARPFDQLSWDDVLAGIQALDPDHRAVLELAYIRGVPYRDIATRLRLHPRTVGTRVFRAKARLRRRLEAVLAARQPTVAQ